jgi:hypothetical protein
MVAGKMNGGDVAVARLAQRCRKGKNGVGFIYDQPFEPTVVRGRRISFTLPLANQCIRFPPRGWQASGLAALDGLQACRA